MWRLESIYPDAPAYVHILLIFLATVVAPCLSALVCTWRFCTTPRDAMSFVPLADDDDAPPKSETAGSPVSVRAGLDSSLELSA